jgi:hypothetical protein
MLFRIKLDPTFGRRLRTIRANGGSESKMLDTSRFGAAEVISLTSAASACSFASKRRHSSAALLLRLLSTSNDHARRRAALENHLVDQSPLRDAGSAYRDRPTEFVTPSTASQRGIQRTSATDRQCRNPHSL